MRRELEVPTSYELMVFFPTMTNPQAVLAAALVALALQGCGNGRHEQTAEPTTAPSVEQSAPPEEVVPEPAATPVGPIAFRIETEGMEVRDPPREGYRFHASGPPGGPLFVRIKEVDGEAIDEAGLRAMAASHSADRQPVAMGTASQVTLDGAPRLAFSVITGESLARTVTCYVVVPAPGTGRSLLTMWGTGAGRGNPDCERAMAHPSLASAASSFALER